MGRLRQTVSLRYGRLAVGATSSRRYFGGLYSKMGGCYLCAREGPDLENSFSNSVFVFESAAATFDVSGMIQVESLTKLYGQFVAVNELSFAVQLGEVLGLVGPNGAGKTTTLRCLAGIIPSTHGIIRICGHDLGREPIPAKRQIAFFTDE